MTGPLPDGAAPATSARVVRTIADVRTLVAGARQAGARIGFVPLLETTDA